MTGPSSCCLDHRVPGASQAGPMPAVLISKKLSFLIYEKGAAQRNSKYTRKKKRLHAFKVARHLVFPKAPCSSSWEVREGQAGKTQERKAGVFGERMTSEKSGRTWQPLF